jgi:DNA primase
MLLELIQEVGLSPKRVSSTQGGEFHSACPECGGTDRFVIWPKTERYWCRQCKKSGDTIQFCRDFMGMSFSDACSRIGKPTEKMFTEQVVERKQPSIHIPTKSWEDQAKKFVEACHQRLLCDPQAIDLIKARGLSLHTIRKHSIGWNAITVFPNREEWGLQPKIEDGKEKKLLVPSGIVIPSFHGAALRKIKIRRNEWTEGDHFGKYYILPGSIDSIPVFGDACEQVVVVVEAELDAMLVAQEVESICCIALGGAQKRPDTSLHQWLLQKKLIIFALDFDEAGKKEYPYWRSIYKANLCLWPVPIGKSPAEAWKLGVDLRKWILSRVQGLRSSHNTPNSPLDTETSVDPHKRPPKRRSLKIGPFLCASHE